MHACSRCGASTPIAASAEVRSRTDKRMYLLCIRCKKLVLAVLEPDIVDDVDDLSNDLMHAEGCRCHECDPDFHFELARDNAA